MTAIINPNTKEPIKSACKIPNKSDDNIIETVSPHFTASLWSITPLNNNSSTIGSNMTANRKITAL